ncbi:MAG: hypothetical protein WDZ68_00315 [Candidatus Paceibacterota bacterium]
MTNISKRSLKKKDVEALFEQLVSIVTKLNKNSSQSFLESIFTPSEQLMFTKRVAAIVMLSKGYSGYKIWTVLNLSPSTVQNYTYQYEKGIYDDFLHSLKKPKNNLLTEIERLIDNIIAPMGKDRWRYLK